MKKTILIILQLVLVFSVHAQDRLFINKSDLISLGCPLTMADSIFFSDDNTIMYFSVSGSINEYSANNIDSLSFGSNADTIFVKYMDSKVNVINPLAFEGVEVIVDGADVTVESVTETKDINFCLSGTSSDAMFKIYSEKRFNLLLNGVNITNPDGPAINNQSGKKMTLNLLASTQNYLKDGSSYATAPNNSEGEEEDQKAAFYSEGDIDVTGSGSLNIEAIGSDQHALASDDEITVEGGNITIQSSQKDAIHAKDGFYMTDGSVTSASSGDGIDGAEGYIEITGGTISIDCPEADVCGIKCDSGIVISGGELDINIEGDQSDGINCDLGIGLSGGNIKITTSGGVVLEESDAGYKASYCNAITSDTDINIGNADLTINSTGIAGKGIVCDGELNISDGSIEITTEGNGDTYTNSDGEADTYKAACISADGNINITGGTLTASSSGSGGRGISGDAGLIIGSASGSPAINITTSGSTISNNDANAESKAVVIDGSITIISGNMEISSADDAFKLGSTTEHSFTMTGGDIEIETDRDGVDCNEGNINISGGYLKITCPADDSKALLCDGNIVISGGEHNFIIQGGQSKGLKSDGDINLSGGSVTINTSGDAVLETSGSGYNPSYCSAIKSDNNVTVSNANLAITCSGEAGKGISCDANFTMSGGDIEISTSGNGDDYKDSSGETKTYKATCFSVDGVMTVTGGSITMSSSGSGGRGISCDGDLVIGSQSGSPTINITTTGSDISTSTSGGGGGPGGGNPHDNAETTEAKAITVEGTVTVNNGTLNISSADDGIKTLEGFTLNDGQIIITKCYEGVEGPNIVINGGEIRVLASDDSFNATYGNGGENDDNSHLIINDGYVMLNSSAGDPLDSNGDLEITGGTTIVHGPQSGVEVGLDVNGSKNISGGTLVVSGPNSMMTEAMSNSSQQYSVLVKTSQSYSNSTLFHIEDESGNNLITFQPSRSYSSLLFSSEDLQSGKTYTIYTGGSCSGTEKDGLYTGGSYSGGTKKKTFSVSSKVTTIQF